MVQSDIYERLVNKYGKEHQLIVTFGELAEATSEIARHMLPHRAHDEDKLIDELADVCIMMEQMKVIYGPTLIDAINKKLNKAASYLK